jgi:alpha-beta hydrolase superfamily lysophospholipase
MMGLITERGSAADGYEAVPVPLSSGEAAESGGAMLRRRSALPSRRSVLYLHCRQDTFVPEDMVGWYTERGFHFYVADLRPEEGQRAHGSRAGRFDRLDAASKCLREAEGHDMIVLIADSADAATAARWCDARREAGGPDALILSSPEFGRRLRRGLDIGCPVLVLSPAGAQPGGRPRPRRSKDPRTIRLGQHVTWLRLDGEDDDRRQFFDEMGRWLGAYMYGPVRDQLL